MILQKEPILVKERPIKGDWVSTDVSSSRFVSSAIEDSFLNLLPIDPRIKRVYWAFENEMLRIWTITESPDFKFDSSIYKAQQAFMDIWPELDCDFSVIYCAGKDIDSLHPTHSTQIYSAS